MDDEDEERVDTCGTNVASLLSVTKFVTAKLHTGHVSDR